MSAASDRAESILRAVCGERLRTVVPMAPLTTFRIGGPAALYLEPEQDADLAAVAEAVGSTAIPVVILGKGSNVLVSDRGFDGLVLRLGRGYRWAARDGEMLTAGGAMPLPALSGVAFHHGLTGLEFGVAIPATIGGAVRMNAGAHGSSMSDVVQSVEVYRIGSGRRETVPSDAAGFAYRRSGLPDDGVVIGVKVGLHPSGAEEIRAGMESARAWRRDTQPLAEPNCGSVFKNPQGDHAARLIEAAGGKGRRVGGMAVSMKHANFIVAETGARAVDALSLIQDLQELVERETGIRLEPEVQLVGEFDRATR
jgi:UDP-N-acetylmuramate dehydrogenase